MRRKHALHQAHLALYALATRQSAEAADLAALPRRLHDTQRLWWGLRDSWERDAVVVQIYGRGGRPAGWWAPEAGAIRLAGLGHAWIGRDEERGLDAASQSTLQIDGFPLNECGLLIDQDLPDAGPARLRLDLGPARKDLGSPWRSAGTHQALRAVLVDHLPGRITAVGLGDALVGWPGATRTWRLWLPPGVAVDLTADGVVLRQGGAALTLRLLTDAPLTLTHDRASGRLDAVGAFNTVLALVILAPGEPAAVGAADGRLTWNGRSLGWDDDRLDWR